MTPHPFEPAALKKQWTGNNHGILENHFYKVVLSECGEWEGDNTMSMLGKFAQLLRPNATPVSRHPYIEHVVNALGAKITEARAFEALLTPALSFAVGYYDNQIQAIPGPFRVSADDHATDRFLAAVFPAREDIVAAFGRSNEVRGSLPDLARYGHVHVHAILGMRYKTARDPVGGGLVFADHTLRSLAPTDAFCRGSLRRASFDRLLNNFSEHVDKLRRKRKLLKVEWSLLNESQVNHSGNENQEFVYAETELAPDNLLKGLISWLQSPSEHLRVAASNVRVVGKSRHGEEEHELPLIHCADRRQWVVCQVQFSVAEALSALAGEPRAHRYILI